MIYQAPIVQELDNAIHWINLCPVDDGIGFCIFIYLINYAMQCLNNWGQVDSAIQHLNNQGQDVLIFLHLYVHVYASVALREKILMVMVILVWTKVSKSHAYDKSDSS